MTKLTLSDSAPSDARDDALVVFATAKGGKVDLHDGGTLPKSAASSLRTTLEALTFSGGADEVVKLTATPKISAPLVAVSGLGKVAGDAPTDEAVRRAAGAAVRALAGRPKVAIISPSSDVDTVAALAEGAALGAYAFNKHRSVKGAEEAAKKAPVAAITVLSTDVGKAAKAAVAHAGVLARNQAWARDLVNTAPNDLYPASFAAEVEKAAPKNVKIEVLDDKALVKGGFGGIVGVGQGSARPPRIVTMSYSPAKAKTHLAFVGKGITFDSGGLCIKPANSMITMKCDMGGAAAVAAAVLSIAELGLPVAVTGYLCLAENMPGSNAQRPGDVVTFRDGQTVEIINTDAEGRLVMADGIALAAESHPDAIVDVATLTGAAMVALGKRTAAVMANDDELQGELTSAATSAGESVWPMPITEETRAGMDSLVADFKHTGEPVGGAMVAAAFLREFAGTRADGEPIAWGHLDIAGPAYNEGGAFGYTPKGGTGFGVRTLVALAEGRA